MTFHISVYTCKVGLVYHREFELLGVVRGGPGSEVEIEGALEDGGVGNGVDVVEGEELEGFLEATEYACWEEEEETCSVRVGLAYLLAVHGE